MIYCNVRSRFKTRARQPQGVSRSPKVKRFPKSLTFRKCFFQPKGQREEFKTASNYLTIVIR